MDPNSKTKMQGSFGQGNPKWQTENHFRFREDTDSARHRTLFTSPSLSTEVPQKEHLLRYMQNSSTNEEVHSYTKVSW